MGCTSIQLEPKCLLSFLNRISEILIIRSIKTLTYIGKAKLSAYFPKKLRDKKTLKSLILGCSEHETASFAIQLTTSSTDFFVAARMAVDLVVILVSYGRGLPRLKYVVRPNINNFFSSGPEFNGFCKEVFAQTQVF